MDWVYLLSISIFYHLIKIKSIYLPHIYYSSRIYFSSFFKTLLCQLNIKIWSIYKIDRPAFFFFFFFCIYWKIVHCNLVHNSKSIHPNAWVLNSERTIDWNFKAKEHNRVEISNLIGTPTDWLLWNRILLDSNKHTFDDFQLKAHYIMASKLMPTILLFPTGNSSTMLEQPQLLSKLSNLCQASS